ncbi:hypothetical protein PGT21_016294 [Puccinia graminis f. sp. tritici]|uniref:LIM zinc-binding domain-containing protein n=1 Tax=Puccinia graminis f. sp. tritici TaxID=56615 RepID=A0A5B0QBI6_PUCGR|nr:hypothetical protein PGT21_016294 [Puccinia graminis f. sp. tritici]
MAGFCRRCGDIIRGSDSRCKCGGSSASSQVTKAMFETTDGSPKHDRWLKTYGERRSVSPASALASRSQSKPTTPSQLQKACLSSPGMPTQPLVPASGKSRDSLADRSLNIMPSETAAPPTLSEEPISEPIAPKEVKRGLSVKSSARAHVRSLTANMPDSVDLSAAEEEVLTNVFGSVLDPHETRGRCGACQQIFKREGKIYPDPRREDESGQWAGVFYCRKCYVQRFSRGKCASCQHTIVGDEGTFIQLGKGGCNGLWHKKCFKCVHCQTDVSNSPSVDLSGNPCCDECFEKPQHSKATSKPSMVTDIPDLRVQPVGQNRTKRISINNSPAAQNIRPAVDELRNKLRKAGIEKEPARPSIPSLAGAGSTTHKKHENGLSASVTPTILLPSVKPLSIVKPNLKSPKADGLRTSTSTMSSFRSSSKITSTAPQHVLSPSANPLCPTCKLSLFRPSLNQTSSEKSSGGAAERIGGTLATLPATGETFHVHCLKCDDCKQAFPNQKYVLLDNLKLCERCVAQRDMIAAQEKFEKMSAKLAKQRDDSVSTRFPAYQSSKATKEWHLAHSESVSPSFPSSHSFQSTHSNHQAGGTASMTKSASENPQLLKKVSTSPFLGGQDGSFKIPSPMTKSLSATRFGGQSICPGCSKPGTITETKLGPNGQRWHFKCLKCVQCHKSLDSGAKTFDDSAAVGCRDCLGKARANKRASTSMQLR